MGKKAILFIIIGVVLGVGLAGVGIFFMLQNGGEKPEEPEVIEEYDITQGKRLSLEKVQIPLKSTGSKTSYLQADFTIIFKTEEALNKANEMIPDIKDAIYGVFEVRTAEELKGQTVKLGEDGLPLENAEPTSMRNAMKEPVLNAIRDLYFNEEDKENIVAVIIPSFIIG